MPKETRIEKKISFAEKVIDFFVQKKSNFRYKKKIHKLVAIESLLSQLCFSESSSFEYTINYRCAERKPCVEYIVTNSLIFRKLIFPFQGC